MRRGARFIQILGVLMILASLGLLAGLKVGEARARQNTTAVTECMTQLLALRISGVMGEGSMPALELNGRDYAALLEVPGLNMYLPVCDDWESRSEVANPCRYWGSVYEGNLILGGGRMAQLEFCAMLDLGDRIVITDLQGREFVYKVDSILRRDDVTFDKLREGEYPLTIFTSDGSSGRSIVVHCGLPE